MEWNTREVPVREETCSNLVSSSPGKAKCMGRGQRLLLGKNWLGPLVYVQPQRCYLQIVWGQMSASPGASMASPLAMALCRPWAPNNRPTNHASHNTLSVKVQHTSKEESSKHCVAQNRQTLRIPRCLDFYQLGKGPAPHLRQFLKHPMHNEETKGSCIIMVIITIIWNTCYSRDTKITEFFHVHKVTEFSL